MLKAYKYRIYPDNEQKYMRKRKKQLVKPTVTITAIDN